jgi:archaellum component FlaF (FlaF/FlaG flagellin family)
MSYITTEKLYREAPDSIKFGTSSARGVLSFELPERERILSVVIEARSYSGDNTTLKVNDVEQALTTSNAEYEFDYSALETATVNITSKNNTSNRFYVSAITIIHSGEEITEPAEPVYHRVEAQRYEIVFPVFVNTNFTYGCLYWGNLAIEDSSLIGTLQFVDEDCLNDGDFYLSLMIYCDGGSVSQGTLLYEVAQGEYGRYIISSIQEWDEPLALTFEPIYEYVLAE